MQKYITYNAGCNTWVVEPFNSNIEWHHNKYNGTYLECKKESNQQMYGLNHPHYENAKYNSIHDY